MPLPTSAPRADLELDDFDPDPLGHALDAVHRAGVEIRRALSLLDRGAPDGPELRRGLDRAARLLAEVDPLSADPATWPVWTDNAGASLAHC